MAGLIVLLVLVVFAVFIAAKTVRVIPQARAGVVERIANHEGVGCVRLDGEIWTARAYDDDEVIEPGTRVSVMEIRGATALVSE